jgi:hypothetical protein
MDNMITKAAAVQAAPILLIRVGRLLDAANK